MARHRRSAGRRGRIVDRDHFRGVAGADGRAIRKLAETAETEGVSLQTPALLRPLAEYEAAAGGAW